MTETTFPKSIWAYVDTRKQVRDHSCNYLRARRLPKRGCGKMILKLLLSSMKFRPDCYIALECAVRTLLAAHRLTLEHFLLNLICKDG